MHVLQPKHCYSDQVCVPYAIERGEAVENVASLFPLKYAEHEMDHLPTSCSMRQVAHDKEREMQDYTVYTVHTSEWRTVKIIKNNHTGGKRVRGSS